MMNSEWEVNPGYGLRVLVSSMIEQIKILPEN